MTGNARFGVAVHILVMLALSDEGRKSARIADSVDTNPVVIRRILGRLRRADLVRAQPGPAGGFRLARPARAITLGQVFRAVADGRPFLRPHRPNPGCAVARGVEAALDGVGRRAERAFLGVLAGETLADAARHARRAGAPDPA